MGKLKIISVTGAVPHSACSFGFDGIKHENGWRGFGPERHRSPMGKGKVFTEDESHRINHGIVFEVPDSILIKARNTVSESYRNKIYTILVCDCVSFSADIARECGMGVPQVNMTPFGLIKILQVWNDYVEQF